MITGIEPKSIVLFPADVDLEPLIATIEEAKSQSASHPIYSPCIILIMLLGNHAGHAVSCRRL